MILPSAHISTERALLTLGAYILMLLHTPSTVSGLWDSYRRIIPEPPGGRAQQYEAFILTLDLLFMMGAIECHGECLHKAKGQPHCQEAFVPHRPYNCKLNDPH